MTDETHKLRAKYANLQISFIQIKAERDAAIAERDDLRSAMQDIKDETTGWGHCVASAALSRQGLLDNSTDAASPARIKEGPSE